MLSRLVSSLWSQRKTDPKSEMSRCFPHIGASAQRQHVDFSVILTIFCLCVSVSVWFEWHWVFSCDNCTYWWKHVILACWMKHVINQRRFAWDCRVVKGFSDFDPWPPLTLPVRSTLMWFGTQQQLAQLCIDQFLLLKTTTDLSIVLSIASHITVVLAVDWIVLWSFLV